MEHFIESVRRYPCLWNTTAIEYRDQELKDAAWAEVRRDTDMASVKEAKLKWKKLRDSYRDALKRQSECAAAAHTPAGKKPYPWKYMAPMHFLQPHMSVRKKQHGSPPPHPAPPAGNPAPPQHHPQPHHAPPPLAAHNGHANGAGERSSSSSSSEAESSPKRRSAERLSAIDRKLDFLCRAHLGPGKRAWPAAPGPGAAPSAAPGPDPLDTFFSGMCQSTKRFPYPAQLRIKRTLFDAVLCAEEALVAEQQSYAALWARAASSSSSEAADGDEAGAGAGAEAGAGPGAGAEADGDADTDDQKPS